MELMYEQVVAQNVSSLSYFVPELILFGTIVLILVADMMVCGDRPTLMASLALGGLALTAAALVYQPAVDRDLFAGTLALDPFATFFKFLFVVALTIAVLVSMKAEDVGAPRSAEYNAMMLTLGSGMFLMASATL